MCLGCVWGRGIDVVRGVCVFSDAREHLKTMPNSVTSIVFHLLSSIVQTPNQDTQTAAQKHTRTHAYTNQHNLPHFASSRSASSSDDNLIWVGKDVEGELNYS